MGSEALRVLLKHPDVSVEWATSRSDTPVEFYHKNFYGRGVRFIKPEQAYPCDAVFFALPTGLTTELSKPFYEDGGKIRYIKKFNQVSRGCCRTDNYA